MAFAPELGECSAPSGEALEVPLAVGLAAAARAANLAAVESVSRAALARRAAAAARAAKHEARVVAAGKPMRSSFESDAAACTLTVHRANRAGGGVIFATAPSVPITRLPPRNFRTLLKRRLALSLFEGIDSSQVCNAMSRLPRADGGGHSFCPFVFGALGRHATMCLFGGGGICAHNVLRTQIAACARAATFPVTVEVESIEKEDATARKQPDLIAYTDRGLKAIDVTITNVLKRKSVVGMLSIDQSLEEAFAKKKRHYREVSCEQNEVLPLVLNSHGCTRPEVTDFIRKCAVHALFVEGTELKRWLDLGVTGGNPIDVRFSILHANMQFAVARAMSNGMIVVGKRFHVARANTTAARDALLVDEAFAAYESRLYSGAELGCTAEDFETCSQLSY